MPPLPPLPPLPPPVGWKALFPRSTVKLSIDKGNREFRNRVLLTNPKIANEFVRALRLRKDEVVIETFPGPGLITRALLNGGNEDGSSEHPKPKLVVACEPSPNLLVSGLGLKKEQVPEEIKVEHKPDGKMVTMPYEPALFETDDPRLLLSPSTPYRWPTLPQLMSTSLVTRHLPVHDPSGQSGPESTKRPWNAPPPPITVVSQMPDSVAGDQMVSQWIGCAIGGSTAGERSWIWEWGRLRMALMVSRNLYDRLMARPSEKIFCKLTVITRALFDITALPPYHHVFNVDKSSKQTESRGIGILDGPRNKAGRGSARKETPPPPDPYPRSTIYPDDFYPIARGHSKHLDVPFSRPPMLSVLLVPKLNSPINADNKDDWDFVLRKCFVTEAQPLRLSLKNLAFGAEGLVEKISSTDKGFAGPAVSCDRIVRDLDVEEWTRVVDVFSKWAFKPRTLILDARAISDDDSRHFGQD